MDSLAAGSTKELTFTYTAVAGDQYWFMADSDEEVPETNENNNSHTAELSLADLEITNVSYSPTSPSVGDDVTWTVTVKNNGPGNATAFKVAFDDDDRPDLLPIDTEPVSSLSAGSTETVTFVRASASGEPYWFLADSDGDLLEADENNNSAEGSISSFSLPDLVIYEVSSNPQYPSAGDSVTWTVTVKN